MGCGREGHRLLASDAPSSVDSGRGRQRFWLIAASYGYGDEGLGMQPGRADASPINPEKLVSSSLRALCKNDALSPSRIVIVAVKPETSGTPGGTLSIAIRTGTLCAKRTQV